MKQITISLLDFFEIVRYLNGGYYHRSKSQTKCNKIVKRCNLSQEDMEKIDHGKYTLGEIRN
jgi:hypothetical protein